MADTLALFPDLVTAPTRASPPGFRYADAVVPPEMQDELMDRARALHFAPFDFRGFKGRRRTVSFGSRYDFTHGRVDPAEPMPDWMRPLRAVAAAFAEVPEAELVQALVTEYAPGAGIGWHRDRPEYGRVVGLSFGADCVLRFRRPDGGRWTRASQALRPRSAYLLDGPARHAWQHSIIPGDRLRYSVTFRTLRQGGVRDVKPRTSQACERAPSQDRAGCGSGLLGEADPFSHKKLGLITRSPPRRLLHAGRLAGRRLRPPGGVGRSLGQKAVDHGFDVAKAHLKGRLPLASEKGAERVVLGHQPMSPILKSLARRPMRGRSERV